MIGRLSSTLYVEPRSLLPPVQLRLVEWLAGFAPDWHARLRDAVAHGYMVVFPQQLAHLVRLAIRHADPRAPDGFADDESRRMFLTCLFGTPDLFYDPDVDLKWLQHRRVRTLSIVSAEDLAALEAAIEEGTPLSELLRRWKRSSATGDHALKNFLIFREREQRRPPSQYHRQMYHETSRALIGEVLVEDDLAEALPGDDWSLPNADEGPDGSAD
jgi:hypothetical protein